MHESDENSTDYVKKEVVAHLRITERKVGLEDDEAVVQEAVLFLSSCKWTRVTSSGIVTISAIDAADAAVIYSRKIEDSEEEDSRRRRRRPCLCRPEEEGSFTFESDIAVDEFLTHFTNSRSRSQRQRTHPQRQRPLSLSVVAELSTFVL